MRRRVGIYVVALCVVLQACGTAQDPKPGSEATAGNAGQGGSAGSTNGGSAGQTASIGGRNDESIGFGGVADEPGDGTAGTDAGVGGTAGSGRGGSAGSDAGGAVGTGGGGTQATSDKLDVLLVIDNSVSMSDKQDVLDATLPAFMKRLTNPLCVDANHHPVTTQPSSISQPCSAGTREFTAHDFHLAVISTSLGAHGGTVCSAPAPGDVGPSTLDDRGELLGKLRANLSTWQGSGFLSWDPAGVTGSSDPAELTRDLTAIVAAAGAHGCGYEAPLEAMYRFLIDPEPPATVAKVDSVSVRQGLDTELLAERAAFLRPDSAVAVLIVSDENDCSIRDDGLGWFVGATSHMPKATVACAANPNDACCRSCAQNESTPPAGCLALSADPVCMGAAAGSYNTWDNQNDSLNLRCFHQKQRFGFDLLYPTARYTTGLSALAVPNNAGALVNNPLFFDESGVQTRSPSLVTLSALVGVPWQDLATTTSLAGGRLDYLDAVDLTAQGRWPILLGDPKTDLNAQDPLMVESIEPRTGVQPLTGFELASAASQNPTQNPINGHEQNVPDNDDLQYACIFRLPTQKVCAPGDSGCDCSPTVSGDASAVTAGNSPVCQPPTGGPAGTTQYYAKAYPGLRELDVIHDLGSRGVPASICPKTLNTADPDFGYSPAFAALLRRVNLTLQ